MVDGLHFKKLIANDWWSVGQTQLVKTFNEFSEFRESDKSLKHAWGSIQRSSLLLLAHEIAGLNIPFLQKLFYKFCRFFTVYSGDSH